jgi:signal transduction histidine kinase
MSNLGTMERYLRSLMAIIDAYGRHDDVLAASGHLGALEQVKAAHELDYLRTDALALLAESDDGLQRVKRIVQNLKDFSYVDKPHWQLADVHQCIDSTLNIVWHEIKYKATVVKDYGDLPAIECLPPELNQVFMNMLVNAGHAIDGHGEITIRTRAGNDEVTIEFGDNGSGIRPEILNRIFDPFFTTKPVGTGTGLGLSLSYGIVQKHHGRIDVSSDVGVGTTFRITLPIRARHEA